MRSVQVTRNAILQKDGDGHFWLFIESSAGKASFNLTAIGMDPITQKYKDDIIEKVLEAWLTEQENRAVDSNEEKKR